MGELASSERPMSHQLATPDSDSDTLGKKAMAEAEGEKPSRRDHDAGLKCTPGGLRGDGWGWHKNKNKTKTYLGCRRGSTLEGTRRGGPVCVWLSTL